MSLSAGSCCIPYRLASNESGTIGARVESALAQELKAHWPAGQQAEARQPGALPPISQCTAGRAVTRARDKGGAAGATSRTGAALSTMPGRRDGAHTVFCFHDRTAEASEFIVMPTSVSLIRWRKSLKRIRPVIANRSERPMRFQLLRQWYARRRKTGCLSAPRRPILASISRLLCPSADPNRSCLPRFLFFPHPFRIASQIQSP